MFLVMQRTVSEPGTKLSQRERSTKPHVKAEGADDEVKKLSFPYLKYENTAKISPEALCEKVAS
jgi:hypothetical protein